MSFTAFFILATGSGGWGACLLALLGLHSRLSFAERLTYSALLGIGLLGWFLFFPGLAGWLTVSVTIAICLAGTPGLLLLRRGALLSRPQRLSAAEFLLCMAILLLLALDLLEAWNPPADADSLAYHFANVKTMLRTQALLFVPRALDGAIPQLLHLTFLPALGLGGERAMTLWAMWTGWLAVGATYVLGRRVLERPWALAVTASLLGTPAILYGAGTGQVETRLSGLVLAAAFAATSSRLGAMPLRFAILSGLLAGFAAGGKLTALLPMAACFLVLALRPGGLRLAPLFCLAAAISGGQWYLWTWIHTGDPVFPMAWPLLHYEGPLWGAEQHSYFSSVYPSAEMGVPRDPLWLLLYPIYASVIDNPVFESGRTGFGPLPLLLLPFAVLGYWVRRCDFARSELPALGLIVALSYTLWFFLGPSQRVRHLLPLLPLLMILLATGAAAATRRFGGLGRPVAAAFAFTLLVQAAGAGLSSLKYWQGLGQSRDEFLLRNVAGYESVKWINEHLAPDVKVAVVERPFLYLLDRPSFLLSPVLQTQVVLRPGTTDADAFLAQVRALGVTHLLLTNGTKGAEPDAVWALTSALLRRGCASRVAEFPIRRLASRTLPDAGATEGSQSLLRLERGPCPAD